MQSLCLGVKEVSWPQGPKPEANAHLWSSLLLRAKLPSTYVISFTPSLRPFKDTIPAPTGQMREPRHRESQSITHGHRVSKWQYWTQTTKKLPPWYRVCVGGSVCSASPVSLEATRLPPSLHFTFSPCVSSTAAFQWVFGCSQFRTVEPHTSSAFIQLRAAVYLHLLHRCSEKEP